MGVFRVIVELVFIKKILIFYEEMFKYGLFVKDRVVSCNIFRKIVIFVGVEEINYDYFVFVCGLLVLFLGKLY